MKAEQRHIGPVASVVKALPATVPEVAPATESGGGRRRMGGDNGGGDDQRAMAIAPGVVVLQGTRTVPARTN